MIEFVIGLWENLYVFYWRQSFLGLLILAIVGLLIFCLKSIWVRRLCAEKVRLLRPNLAFRGVSNYFYYWLLKTLCNPMVSIIIGLLLVTLWNYSFLKFGENFFVCPGSSNYSILVTKFSGIETQDRFGELGTRDLIAREFYLSADSVTAEVIDVSFSNSTCANGLEAEQLRSDRNFDMLTWGFVESGADSLTVTVGFCWEQPLSFIPVHRQSDTMYFDLLRNMSFTMPVTHTVRPTKLHNWVRKISLSGLMAAAMEKELWESAVMYLDRITAEFPDFEGDDALAYSWFKSKCLNEICINDKTRWDELLEAAVKCDSISATYESFPQSFLTVIKWYAGKALVGLGEMSRAESYFRQAIDADSGNVSAFIDLSELLFFKLKKYDESLEIAHLGLKIGPSSVPLLQLAALNCFSLNMWTESLYYLEALNEVQPDKERTVYFLIYANLASSNVHLADSLYRTNLTKWPCLRLLIIDFAQAYIRTGETTKARHALRVFNSIDAVEADECADKYGIARSHFQELDTLLTRNMQEQDVDDAK